MIDAKQMAEKTYESKKSILNKTLSEISWTASQAGKYSITIAGGIWEESKSPVKKYVVDSLVELGYIVSTQYNKVHISWYPETQEVF